MALGEVLNRIFRPYFYYIIGVTILVLFIVIGYYAYKKLMGKKDNKMANVANANRRSNEAIVYFFHVDWCPHCKKALPEWQAFSSRYDKKEINGYIIKCLDKNCTDETSEVTEFINKYNIDSYPTIKMIRDNKTIDFETKITNSTLEKFVNTML